MARKGKASRKSRPVVPRNIVKFNRTKFYSTVGKTAADQGGYYAIGLTDLPGYTDFTSLYSFYKIDKVTFTWDLTTANLATGTAYPKLYTAIDQGDVGVASLDAITAYSNCTQHQFGPTALSYTRTVAVKPSRLIFSGVTSAYGPDKDGWIATGYSGVSHYGMKYWIYNYNNAIANSSNLTVTIKAVVSCYGPK